MRRPTSFARRFIAGETVAEAIEAARALEARGMTHTLDLLGESVTSLEGADAATRAYLATVDAIVAAGIERNISLKLTQLGLDATKPARSTTCARFSSARAGGFFVRIDMEDSAYTEVTLERLRDAVASRPPADRRRPAVRPVSQRARSAAHQRARRARAAGQRRLPRAEDGGLSAQADVDAATRGC
jgi:proline dehydrogenase